MTTLIEACKVIADAVQSTELEVTFSSETVQIYWQGVISMEASQHQAAKAIPMFRALEKLGAGDC